ncbi:MAG: aspartate kinase [Bryobacteraceae bacterium]
MKFGGTSMGSADRIKIAAKLTAEQHAKRPVTIIVSAMSKVTDLLLDTLKKAETGDAAGLEANLVTLTSRHAECAAALLPADRQEAARAGIEALTAEFSRIARGMLLLGERPPKSVDQAIAIGERLSAFLIAEYLNSEGIPTEAVNAASVIATDAVFGNATPLMDATKERAAKVLRPLLDKRVLPVVTGFNASTLDGRPTTLGRGGSDFSASIIAAALDASELWIWTDVDGIMSADPRLVKNARVLPEVTYAEAAELAYNGAKVLHPRTLAPLAEKKIPVWSKNSFAPEKPGTRIVPIIEAGFGPRAVTSMTDIAMVSIEPASAEISGTKVMAEAIEALSRSGVEVMLITSSSYTQSFCFLVRQNELERAKEFLQQSLALEIAHDYLKPIQIDKEIGLMAVVGEGMRGTPGLAGRIFTAISRNDINIVVIAQGSSELTIAVVVDRKDLEKAVQAVHEECGMGEVR